MSWGFRFPVVACFLVTVVGLTTRASVARADPPAVEAAASSEAAGAAAPSATAAATATASAAAVADAARSEEVDPRLEREQERLERLHDMYDAARQVFGRQHVLLTPSLSFGRRCSNGTNVFSCPNPLPVNQGGLAGLVIVPVFGIGGGHGADWWPIIETDDLADGFYRFDKQFRRMRDRFARRLDLPEDERASPEVLLRRFNTLAQAFDSLLSRTGKKGNEGYYADDAERLKRCLDVLASAPVLAGNTPASETDEPHAFCTAGMSNGGAQRGWTMRDKLKLLDALWREHDLLVDAAPLGRHNFLIGPLAGVSITDEFGDLLYGAGIEAGVKDYLRVTLSGGFRSSMHGSVYLANFDTVGWWFGLGLSGQISDQLFNAILGADRMFAGGAGGDR